MKNKERYLIFGGMLVLGLLQALIGWNMLRDSSKAGTNTLATRSAGQVIQSSDVNQYKTALGEDIVPRDTNGVASTLSGGLGTSTYVWDTSYLKSIELGSSGTTGHSIDVDPDSTVVRLRVADSIASTWFSTGFDGTYIKPETVSSIGILNLNVGNLELAANAVTTDKVTDGTLTGTDIQDESVEWYKLDQWNDESQGCSDIAAYTVTNAEGQKEVTNNSMSSTSGFFMLYMVPNNTATGGVFGCSGALTATLFIQFNGVDAAQWDVTCTGAQQLTPPGLLYIGFQTSITNVSIDMATTAGTFTWSEFDFCWKRLTQ